MGVERISGRPLARVCKAQLYAVFFEMRDRGWYGEQVRDGSDNEHTRK